MLDIRHILEMGTCAMGRDRTATKCYFSVIACSPNCSLIRRLTSFLIPSPVFVRTKSFDLADQSSLKLVERAEIQIWRTGEFGEMTNLPGGSSKLMCNAPALSSTSKSASPSASYRLCFNFSSDSSDSRRNS